MKLAVWKWRHILLKDKRAQFIVLCILCVFVWVRLSTIKKNEHRKILLTFYKEQSSYLDHLNDTECKLPEYDLYHPEILKYINKPPTPIDCGHMQPYLTYLDWNGVLHLNKTEIDANYKKLKFKCHYNTLTVNKENDYIVDYGKNIPVTFPMKITHPTVRVECYTIEKDTSIIYRMVHTQIIPLEPERIWKNEEIPKHRPSLLLFGLDSLSRGNFIRALPLTYKYLVSQGLTVIKGLNKVADNTFPNMMALLAGFTSYNKHMTMPLWRPDVNATIKGYDEMPIVWKFLREQGYTTMYCEEYLDTIFSYVDVGFKDDPVDYYYRAPYVGMKQALANIGMNKMKFWNRSKFRYCLGNEPSYKYMLNYTEEFLTKMAHLRYFALSFFVEMSHEYLTDITNMDQDLYLFFKKMFSNNYFNNTIVLVFGDHGHRFDDIRSTYIGRLEERLPFFGIYLPDALKKTYPNLQRALNTHTERLLSWFDIHMTLMDIVDDDLGEVKTVSRPGYIGKSIFREFNESRTCYQIGIYQEYCACDRESKLPVDSELSQASANVAVNHINSLLSSSYKYVRGGDSRKCAELSLKTITLSTVSMKTLFSESFSVLVRVMFYVLPSEGMFEAAVEHRPDAEPVVIGDINRINKYNDQPSCIAHKLLRMYCYCVGDTKDHSTKS